MYVEMYYAYWLPSRPPTAQAALRPPSQLAPARASANPPGYPSYTGWSTQSHATYYGLAADRYGLDTYRVA